MTEELKKQIMESNISTDLKIRIYDLLTKKSKVEITLDRIKEILND